jgi:hypothetical protein
VKEDIYKGYYRITGTDFEWNKSKEKDVFPVLFLSTQECQKSLSGNIFATWIYYNIFAPSYLKPEINKKTYLNVSKDQIS